MGIIIGGNTISGTIFNTIGEITNSPSIVTAGLVLWLDAGNNYSYINSPNYYDCGYGPQFYASDPGCTPCNTQWKDMSGYGNDWLSTGTYNGTYFTYNGQSQSKSAAPEWLSTNESTIDTWFYPANGGINTGCCDTIFGRYYFRFFMIGNSIYFMVGFANSDGSYNTYQHPAFSIAYDTWHHVVGVRRGNNYIIWIDGVEMYNTTFGSGLILYLPNETWYISSSTHSNVRISSVKIYNRGIADMEIVQNFNAGRQRFGI